MNNLILIQIEVSGGVTESNYQKLLNGEGRLQEEITARPYYQHTGFTSIPKDGSRCVGFIDGNQVTIVASADLEADRPLLSNAKDVAIYADKTKFIKIAADGVITIDNGTGKIVMGTDGQVNINEGSLTVDV